MSAAERDRLRARVASRAAQRRSAGARPERRSVLEWRGVVEAADFGDAEWEWVDVDGGPPLLARKHIDARLSGDVAPTGGRVWRASLVLARAMERAALARGRRVLELGAGASGVPGLRAATAGAAEVLLTDFDPANVEVLAANAAVRRASTAERVSAEVLAWGAATSAAAAGYDVVLLADCVHAGEAASRDLARTLASLLRGGAVAVACWERRPLHARSEAAFFSSLAALGLRLEDASAWLQGDDELAAFGLRLVRAGPARPPPPPPGFGFSLF